MARRNESESIDQLFILLALRDRGVEQLISLDRWNLEKSQLSEQGQQAYEFIKDYYESHGEAPGYELVIVEVGWPRITYSELPKMVPEEAANIILDRAKQNRIKEALSEIRQALNEDTEEAVSELVRQAEEAKKIGTSGDSNVIESFSEYPTILDQYEQYSNDEIIGYHSPWPTITDASSGYQPGQVVYFCARPGTGKTWCLIRNMLCLYEQGLTCLFVSPEMSKDEIIERQALMHAKISYSDYKDGELTNWAEEDLKEHVEEHKNKTGIKIHVDEMSYSKDDVEHAVYRYDPDAVFVDTFYKFGEGDDEFKKTKKATEWLWRIARTKGRKRIVQTAAQMGKSTPQKPSAMNLSNVYGTDKIAQNAHLVYGLFQDEDMSLNDQMGFEQMKGRDAEYHSHFFSNWSFDSMDFTQITHEEKQEAEDENEYDDYL